LGTLSAHRKYLIVLAVLMAALVALYPYLVLAGQCEHVSECPYVAQSSSESSHAGSASLVAMCLSAVLAASFVGMLALAAFYGRRIIDPDRRPADVFLSLDPPPPKLSLSR